MNLNLKSDSRDMWPPYTATWPAKLLRTPLAESVALLEAKWSWSRARGTHSWSS